MTTVMMKCGHSANAVMGDKPVCAICAMTHTGWDIVDDDPPDLAGRKARCHCGREEPSHPERLAFFEFCGPGSDHAVTTCGTCHYALVAHGEVNRETGRPGITDHEFVPAGDLGHDRFYCGCDGWD